MAERGEESSDGSLSSSVDSCEDFGSPSPSSSSGESANEVEPYTSSISRPSSDGLLTKTIRLVALDFYGVIADSGCALVYYHAIEISSS